MKSLVVSSRWLVVGVLCFAAVAAVAAPRSVRLRMPRAALTNSFELGGVKFPPRYTEEQFRLKQEAFKAFRQEEMRIAALAEEHFQSQLTDAHRKVLREMSRQQEEEFARQRAETAARNAELVAITNRKAYVVKEYHEKRRSEYHYQPESLYWMGGEVFMETVTRAEKGKIVVHILYTRDKDGKEKRHRYDPDSIKIRLQEAARKM